MISHHPAILKVGDWDVIIEETLDKNDHLVERIYKIWRVKDGRMFAEYFDDLLDAIETAIDKSGLSDNAYTHLKDIANLGIRFYGQEQTSNKVS